MRTYEPLIRLARFRVEGLQEQMSALAQARADLLRQAEQLAESVPEERIAASASKDGFVAYGSYAQAVIMRKQNLRVSIEEVDAQAASLREALEDARAELTKYEAMEERRVASERAKGEAASVQGGEQKRRAAS